VPATNNTHLDAAGQKFLRYRALWLPDIQLILQLPNIPGYALQQIFGGLRLIPLKKGVC